MIYGHALRMNDDSALKVALNFEVICKRSRTTKEYMEEANKVGGRDD